MEIMHVSTNPGMPSTLWKGEDGNYYRTKREALACNGLVIDPDEIEISKSYTHKYRDIIIASVISCLITILLRDIILKK